MINRGSRVAYIHAPRGRDAQIATTLLREAMIESTIARSLTEVSEAVHTGAGFIIIAEEALTDDALLQLEHSLKSQPVWSDMPFILLTVTGGGIERDPTALKYISTLGNVTFLERPFHPTTFISLCQSALRSRRRQYEASDMLQTIKRGEERFKAAIAAIKGVIWTNDPNGQMTGEQLGWAALTGQSRAEYEGYGWSSAVHPDDAQPTIDAWKIALEHKIPFVFEHRLRRHDGVWRNFAINAIPTLNADGSIDEWVGVHTDITDQLETAAELQLLAATLEQRVIAATDDLRASEARMRSIFETSYQYFVELAPDGTVTDANATSLALVGSSLNAVVGKKFWQSPWFADSPELVNAVRWSVKRGAQGQTIKSELSLKILDNDYVVDFSMRPIRDGSGTIIALIYEALDITERRRAEEQLFQSQKLETIGQLTGGVAHDFNNLLMPILASLDLARRRLEDDSRAHRLLEAGLQSAERAKTLVSRLLAFARKQLLERRAVDVAELIENTSDLIIRSVGPNIAVKFDIRPDLKHALADTNQLELGLLNLVVNARDAMPNGGEMWIEAYMAKSAANGTTDNEYVVITVADTGSGMDQATVKRAVEPFFTTKEIGKGTGLGLSMIHGLVGQLGGHMNIKSLIGVGTRVELWFVASTNTSKPLSMDNNGPAAAHPARIANIILVDDDDNVRLVTADILRHEGHNVIEFSTAQAALDAIISGQRANLLITDQLMPGMTGTELASRLEKHYPTLPILITSGHANLPETKIDRLDKPYKPETLIERVRHILSALPTL